MALKATVPSCPDIVDLACPAGPALLQSVGKVQGVVHFVALKDVQFLVEQDFPACVRHDMPGMQTSRGVKLPGEGDALRAGGFLNFEEVRPLLFRVEFVLFRDEVYLAFIKYSARKPRHSCQGGSAASKVFP